MGLGLSVVRGHRRTRPMTSTSPMEESRGKAYIVDSGKLGLGQRSRTTHEESRGKAYVRVNRKLGLRCIDRGKKHDLG